MAKYAEPANEDPASRKRRIRNMNAAIGRLKKRKPGIVTDTKMVQVQVPVDVDDPMGVDNTTCLEDHLKTLVVDATSTCGVSRYLISVV